jgi:hypothetical protein
MRNKVKTDHQPRKVNFASRAILGSGLLFAIMRLYENDLMKIFLTCSRYALYLLSAHVLYIFYWKKKARMEFEWKETCYAYLLIPLVLLQHPLLGLINHDINEFVTYWAITVALYFVFKYLKITHNASESELLLKNTKYHIGPGLAQANFRFLENVIKGNEKHRTPGHVEQMRNYRQQEEIKESSKSWFCPKVLILFPEWKRENRERIWGSVYDIFKKEKENGSNHKLSNKLSKISYDFKVF